MREKQTEDYAFPSTFHNGWGEPEKGMTLRDYFAAQALTGSQIWDAVLNDKNAVLAQEGGAERLAQVAYAVADAMLKARTA